MNVSSFVCPSCKEKNSIQSVPAIVSASTSSGFFSGTSGGVVSFDGQVGYTTSNINLNGNLTSNLARQLAPPEKPEIYRSSSANIIWGTVILLLLWPYFIYVVYKYYKKRRESKERLNFLAPKWPKAYAKWKASFYCHRCGIVFDPNTGEYCNPLELDSFLDYQY